LKEGRKANIPWQCNLEGKEGLPPHPIGEAEHQVQDQDRVLAKIANPDIKASVD
jgi:hypothetical protein